MTATDPAVEAAKRAAAKLTDDLGLPKPSSYHTGLKEVAGKTSLFNGKIFRLLDAQSTPTTTTLAFSAGYYYYDYLDTSEVLAYESMVAHRCSPAAAAPPTRSPCSHR